MSENFPPPKWGIAKCLSQNQWSIEFLRDITEVNLA